MHNFMNCTNMIFGSKVRYCITFKTNCKNFEVFTRKHVQGFKVRLLQENLEGSKGIDVESMGTFLVSKKDSVHMYDAQNFQEKIDHTIKIQLMESKTREVNQIISMVMCPYEQNLAIISGKNLIMNEQKPNQLFIYIRRADPVSGEQRFIFLKKLILADMAEFRQISM